MKKDKSANHPTSARDGTEDRNTFARWAQALRVILDLPFLLFRLTNAIALTLHGFGHALALYAVKRDPRVLGPRSILEGISPRELLKSILPLGTMPQHSANPPCIAESLATPCAVRLVAAGGIVMNLVGLVAAIAALAPYHQTLPAIHSPSMLALQALVLCFCVSSLLTMLSLPDLLGVIRGRTPYLACGPAFAIRYRLADDQTHSPSLVSTRLAEMVEVLAREAATRGGQSCGFSIIARRQGEPSIVFDKAVKGKRKDIVTVLCQKLDALVRKAGKEGYKGPGSFEAVLLHLRYATGGATNWHNAQPHWYEHYDAMMHHRVENGRLVSRSVEVFNMIAHNGDMDAVHLEWSVDGERVRRLFSQQEARAVLQTIMPKTTSQGNSDSRTIAEWVDFIYTQGLAYKALRYAYFTTALDFNRDICHGRFDADRLHSWADQVDLAMLNAADTADCLKPGADSINEVSDQVKVRVRQALTAAVAETLDADRAAAFIDAFEEAFYTHNLTWVMRQASRNLVGEFALMVCTTLERRMGVFSLTQAFSIGHNRTRGEIFGSAEPQGVTSALHRGCADDDALQINLEDGQYATIDYQEQKQASAIRIYDRATESDDFSLPPKPAANTVIDQAPNRDRDSAWFPVNNNPKIDRSTRTDMPGEEIRRDLQEIPYILRRVVDSFEPHGENAATMNHFCELLFQNLSDPERDPDKHDLVLYGVDFNQDLIGEFALALRPILPDLRIRTENSGNVLKEMKRTRREGIGNYGPKTIFLGVSNSAQTQSTLAAARKAIELVGAERCFVLTQSFLNSMTQALGQGYHPDDPVLPNTFVNLSHLSPDGTCGRRRSEAATIVAVATQAVLTEILIGLTQKALEQRQHRCEHCLEARLDSCPQSHRPHHQIDIRNDMELSDIVAFREFQSAVYDVEIPHRIGCNAAGEPIDSPDLAAVEKEAEARAENNVEFVRSYALFALYIVVATLFGVPVFGVLSTPLQSIPGVNFIAHALDAMLFLCALWLIHLGIRYWQGRPVFERIGARAELYIDRKYIARMVERYNATLFSNAPAFITPFFYWADTVQDALHRFGIRAHRGVVTIHRTPDERMGVEEANNAAEENMVLSQIGGIRFNFGQPQSRDTVRNGSHYMNRTPHDFAMRPYQTVLSDSLESLRNKYDQKLSPQTLRLINRRLIDLSDGLVFEFVVGARRKEIVDQAIWKVIRWLPLSHWIDHIALSHGIDLKRISGNADTANQAQIQSTKHPVSPMDINIDTIQPKPTFDALRSNARITDQQPAAILVFFEHYLSISLGRDPALPCEQTRPPEILLQPGQGSAQGTLVDVLRDERSGRFTAYLQATDAGQQLIVSNPVQDVLIELNMADLSDEQRHFLTHRLGLQPVDTLPQAA